VASSWLHRGFTVYEFARPECLRGTLLVHVANILECPFEYFVSASRNAGDRP
jgi:hypothetical protein